LCQIYHLIQGGLKGEAIAFDAYIFKTLKPICMTLAHFNVVLSYRDPLTVFYQQ